MSATVAVDRELLIATMQEAYNVSAVVEAIAGVCPTTLTEEISTLLERLQRQVFGEYQCDAGGAIVGPHAAMWSQSSVAAAEYFRSLAGTEAVAS